MFTAYTDKPFVYSGKTDAQAIVDFMEPKLYPAVNELRIVDYNNLQETDLTQLVLFVKESDKDASYVKEFDKAAESRSGGKTVFFKASTKEAFSYKMAIKFGFNNDVLPKLVAFKFVPGEITGKSSGETREENVHHFEGNVESMAQSDISDFLEKYLNPNAIKDT
jgi:hypothetical protein